MRTTRNKKLVGATMAAILLGALAGCGDSQSSESLVADAQQFIQKGDTKAAVIQLKNALIKNPSDVQARLTLGALYNDMGDAASAEKEFRKARDLGATAAQTMPGLATALLMQLQFQKLLDDTAGANTADPALMTLRGDASLGLGQADKAREAYEQALKAKPGFPAALVGLARHALVQKDIAGARRFAEQAVAAGPNDPAAWQFKADLLRAQDKPDEAIAAYDKVLEIKPGHRSVHVEKAMIEIGQRKFDAARASIAAARKAAPNSLMVTYAQALLDFNEGKHAAARESLQKVLAVAPDHMLSVLLAGAVEQALGALPQSEQHLKKYVEAMPAHPYARKLLAMTLLRQGRTAEAREALAPLMAEADKDPQLLALAGELAMQARDYARAADYLERAAKVAPQAASVRTSLAMSKLAQGDDARAIIELEESTRLDAKSSKAGALLVLTEMRLKRFDKALAAVKAMEAELPKDPMVRNLKGGVFLGMGDAARARASFEEALVLQPTYFPAAGNLAQMAMKDKNSALAKKHLTSFLANDPKNIEAMGGLADLAGVEGKPAEATQWLEKAQAANPEALAPALRLAGQYLRTGDRQKALALLRKFQVAHPSDPDLLDVLGQAQLASGDSNGALESFSKLVAAAPKSPMAHYRMASMHMLLKKPADAADSLKKALALKPDFVDAQVAQAELALRAGANEQAIAIARQIQKQRTDNFVGYALEGNVLLAQGKAAQALAPLERAVALNAAAANIVKLHSAMARAGKGAEANARLLQWERERPDDPALTMYVAETMLAAKQYKPAIARLERALKQAPNNAAVLNNLAWAYQQESDPRALKTAEQAFALAGESAAILDTLGHMLVEQGNTARGLGYLRKAVALAPADADIRYHLAQGLAKSGDKAGARKELEQVMANKDFSAMDEARALHKQL